MFKLLRKLFESANQPAISASISASIIKRPEFHVEQLTHAGKMEPNRLSWSAMTFTASLDPFDYDNTVFNQLDVSVAKAEHWRFYNAKIALLPGQDTMITSDDIVNQLPLNFVVIFDKAERITVPSRTEMYKLMKERSIKIQSGDGQGE